MREPTISYEDAAEVCAQPWPTEPEAHGQAVRLKEAGWLVEWRNPPVEFGHGSGVLIVATIYHPKTYVCPGDVTYELGGRPA
jgi:hypothetical protein